MRKLRILLICIGTGLIAGAAAGIGIGLHISSFGKTPHRMPPDAAAFHILPGQSLAAVSADLEKNDIISSAFLFKILVRFKGADKRIQAGEYSFQGMLSPDQIIAALVKGKVKLYRLTIPEGLTIEEIAGLAEAAGFCPAQEFTGLATDPEVIRFCGIDAGSLEGYLFPETYFFPRDAPCRTILKTMTDRFFASFPPEWEKRAAQIGLSRHEIVTLASIIEKETGQAGERPLISSVFHNRLKKNMRLESDPTVIYGISDYNGNIKRAHLRQKTPYNTYVISGLPPGPIANPGKDALQAALYPADSPYLFFVSKKNGAHYFSETFREHNRAVKKYLLSR